MLSGGSGIDTARYAADRTGTQWTALTSGSWLVSTAGEGTDHLQGIERLQFANTHIALDLDGNAGLVARIIGALFGVEALADAGLVGIGLALRDVGMSAEALVSAALGTALFAQLAGGVSDAHFVRHVYENVVGSAPSPADEHRFVGLLQGGHTRTELALLACDDSLTAVAIDLVGLAVSGLEYLPPE